MIDNKQEKSILFICTGNIFRSLTAEKCFKKYLADQKISDWQVGSAGIFAEKQDMYPQLVKALQDVGVTDIKHVQRKLTKEILDSYDVVVCMAQNHLDFLESEFGYKGAMLFNILAKGENTSVLDIEDEVSDYFSNPTAVDKKIKNTVEDINQKIPELFKVVSERYYLFSDFVNGKKTHRNGFPFIPLHETPNALAFMSVDIPRYSDGHILVIPKKRYADFSQIPAEIASDIFTTLSLIGKTLAKYHDGYNILLNNGVDAGQYIFHTHFHMMPRKKGDGIKLEGWEHNEVTPEEFISLNESLKKQIDSQK